MTQKILIIGAGGLGMITGYHLSQAGAEVSFFVRPNRLEALSRPQRLYSFGEHRVNSFEGYQVISDLAELKGRQFDYILLTFDGAICRSEEGTALLKGLGQMLAGSGAKLMICGVGIGLYDYVKVNTGFAEDDMLEGTMVSFSYQVGREGTPQPPETDKEMHDSSDFAYLDFADRRGFMVAGSSPAAKTFAALFNKSGMNCSTLPSKLYRGFTSSFVAFTTIGSIKGWPSLDTIIADTELWNLCCRCQKEILRLKQHGLMGKLMGLMMSEARQAKMMREMAQNASSMGFIDFFRFHHGGKVQKQNIEVLENCIKTGKQQGQDMAACSSLLARFKAAQAA